MIVSSWTNICCDVFFLLTWEGNIRQKVKNEKLLNYFARSKLKNNLFKMLMSSNWRIRSGTIIKIRRIFYEKKLAY